MAYPTALQCSGLLSMSEIRDWMIAATELPPSTTTVSLSTLISSSHLTDKTPPSQISQFYCYAVPVVSCGSSFNISSNRTYERYEDVVVGTTSGDVGIVYDISNGFTGGTPVKVKIEVQYSGGPWETVLPLTDVTTSLSGTANYSFTYTGSDTIRVRVTKGIYYL